MANDAGSMGSGNSVSTSNAQEVNLSQEFAFAGPIVNVPSGLSDFSSWLLPAAGLAAVYFAFIKKGK
jgi:hypothetical protein